jgi:glycine/D-amino acid oxidase-like deaminating enzyme
VVITKNVKKPFDLDTLIVGQGLAGSLLAWELLERGERILVLDDGHQSAASTAAAGLLNPVTGQRLVKTAGVDLCLPFARECYRTLEQRLGLSLLVEKPMWRLFRNEREQEAWERRSRDPAYSAYLGERLEAAALQPPFIAPQGGFTQHQTGFLDTNALMAGTRDYLSVGGHYRRQAVEYGEIEPAGEGVRFDDMTCRRVIFCEGYKAQHNPWFDWLPFQPAKGEILSLEIDTPLPDAIINAGKWLMPRGGDDYRLGATYEREQLDEQPTEAGLQELLDALPQLLAPVPDYSVIDHRAGVRPNTLDKQPFIGLHPTWPQLGIFNGFGSKGSLLIPWHAARFADSLLGGAAPPGEADILRYLSRRDPC